MHIIQDEIFKKELTDFFGGKCGIRKFTEVSGGCISRGGKLETTEGDFFLKINTKPLFEAEARGLQMLASSQTVHVPDVILQGKTGENFYILLRWLQPEEKEECFWQNLALELAALHRKTAKLFGLDHSNYIGALPQQNNFHSRFVDFFIEERIEVQLKIAEKQFGQLPPWLVGKIGKLSKFLENVFPAEKPALLHGDLWSGNIHSGPGGKAYVIDPAVYYGHREAEVAFTQLFEGFPPAFYHTYNDELPLQKGFSERKDFYNLYPLLVHWNLFGESYLHTIKRILERI